MYRYTRTSHFNLFYSVGFHGYDRVVVGLIIFNDYDFRSKTLFGLSLPLVVCRRAHVLFTLFVFVGVLWCLTHIVCRRAHVLFTLFSFVFK